jgi:hypothetical protein
MSEEQAVRGWLSAECPRSNVLLFTSSPHSTPQARVGEVGRKGRLSGTTLVESETSRRVGRSGACATLNVVNVMPLDG